MSRKRTSTIFIRIFIPLFLIMLLQSSIFYVVTTCGNTVTSLESNAVDILSERVDNRQSEIVSMLISRWGNFTVYNEAINKVYSDYREQYEKPLYSDIEQKRLFLTDISETLFKMIRTNEVNGVFVILANSDQYVPVSDEIQSYYGLCIRDYDAVSGYTDKDDLLIERCPTLLTTKLGCSLDSYWEATYTFSTSANKGEYFYKPIEEAYSNPGISADNFLYFCSTHVNSDGERPIVSYSIPLISSDGVIYGVLGVELLTSYISTLIPKNELISSGNASYILAQYQEGSYTFDIITTSGTYYQQSFGDIDSFSLDASNAEKSDSGTIVYEKNGKIKSCFYISTMKIYNENTPFDNTKLALIGVLPQSELFEVSANVRQSLLVVTGLILLLGIAGIFMVSHLLTRPIKRLAKSVGHFDVNDMKLSHINIEEIDQLVDAIVDQSKKINQAKVRTEFLSRMSHDMRTPMNAIIGFSSPQIIDGCGNEELLDNLAKINESGQYLLGLINEVLDMTKIDSGKMELQNKPFELNSLWPSITPMIDELALKKKIYFEKRLPQISPDKLIVIGDPQRLSQIVVNLLSNAIKFTPENGKVTLSADISNLNGDNVMLTICVKDTGIGMSPEFQKKLYTPFVQEHTDKDGTGLGLSIVHQLVALMSGTVECVSEKGAGTEFTVRIKLPVSHDSAVAPDVTLPLPDGKTAGDLLENKYVLLCEDHKLNQQIACKLLERYKIKVDLADNGFIGVELFKKSSLYTYDAVLMDIRMPVMDGLEATKAIRKLDRPDAAKIPIIAMTANAFDDDKKMTIAAGMNEHLAKPIEPDKLYATLVRLIMADCS